MKIALGYWDQSWVFIGRTDVEAATPILWPPDAKSWLIWKDRDAGKDWRPEEKGTTEDEMAGWHHWLDGCESEWTPGVMDREAWRAVVHGVAESDTTEGLNWTELKSVDIKKSLDNLNKSRSLYYSPCTSLMNKYLKCLFHSFSFNIHILKRNKLK